MAGGRTALIAALAAAALAPTSAAARDIVVNDDTSGVGPAAANCSAPERTTIQSAVDAAAPGDRILVCAGSYSAPAGQPAATVGKSVALLGPKADAQRTWNPFAPDLSGEALVDGADGGFDVHADGVAVSGFAFTHGAPAVSFEADTANHQIDRNLFFDNDAAIDLDLRGPATIARNSFFAPCCGDPYSGIRAADFSQLTIAENFGLDFAAAAGSGDPAESLRMIANDVVGVVSLENVHGGLIENNGMNGFRQLTLAGGNRDLQITGNDFRHPQPVGAKVQVLSSPQAGPSQRLLINRNVFDQASFIERNGVGVSVGPDAVSDELEIHQNRFWGNANGAVRAEGTGGRIDAENNWWGCNEGPAGSRCDQVTGSSAASVDTDPHLLFTADGTLPVPSIGGGWFQVLPGFTLELRRNSAGEALQGGPGGIFAGGNSRGGPYAYFSLDPPPPNDFRPPDSRAVQIVDGVGREGLGGTAGPATVHVRATLDAAVAETDVFIPELGECETYNDYFYRGTSGDDKARGTGKDDRMNGRGGDDDLSGRGGGDCIAGARGDDELEGGNGSDFLAGARGRNRLSSGPGRDGIDAKNGTRDFVDCGAGKDFFRADPQDHVRNCEKRIRRGRGGLRPAP